MHRGVEGFKQLMTVNKRLCATFKEACFAYGLLNDDKESLKLWEENWQTLSEDILHKKRKLFNYPDLQLTDEQIRNDCLMEIKELLHKYGIASLLLPTGRTAHSRFVIPLELMKNSTCSIKHNTQLVELMLEILPVIPKAKRPEVVQACINRFELWRCCKVFTLTRSMRVNEYSPNGEIDTSKQEFNRCVLAVGDGTLPAKMKEREDEPTWIEILEKFLIKMRDCLTRQIVEETYLDFTSRQTNDEYIKEREILTLRNKDTDALNEFMFQK
ncbi:ATP-dependent DNA helicase PIF1-like protein [Tanacetum coccineum]